MTKQMTRYRIICPECGAVVFAVNRHAAIWEICPSCRRHTWDVYDVLLGDIVSRKSGQIVNTSGFISPGIKTLHSC